MELINDTLGGLLEKWAQEQPDHDFLVYPDRNLRFSYRQFSERVDTLAKALLEIGVTKGSKVGVWAKNVPDWLTFMFASARIAGWCANRIEEVVTCHRIMRPAYRAVVKRVHYEPIGVRSSHFQFKG